MKERLKNTEPKLAAEMKQFQAIGAWCTPEFLMQSSQTMQSTQRVAEHSPNITANVAGTYRATRHLFSGAGQIDAAVADLRQRLEGKYDKRDSKQRAELLALWTALEPGLCADEHRELGAAALERLFPDSKRPSMHRNDGSAQVGGH